jgi:hypothetical protein
VNRQETSVGTTEKVEVYRYPESIRNHPRREELERQLDEFDEAVREIREANQMIKDTIEESFDKIDASIKRITEKWDEAMTLLEEKNKKKRLKKKLLIVKYKMKALN